MKNMKSQDTKKEKENNGKNTVCIFNSTTKQKQKNRNCNMSIKKEIIHRMYYNLNLKNCKMCQLAFQAQNLQTL